MHLDRGYDSGVTRGPLTDRAYTAAIAEKGKPALVQAGSRWVVERTNSWHNSKENRPRRGGSPARNSSARCFF